MLLAMGGLQLLKMKLNGVLKFVTCGPHTEDKAYVWRAWKV